MGDVRSVPIRDPAQAYETYFVANQLRHWADALLDRARPRVGERILDVGCGTGIVARRAARRLGNVAQVTGIDPSTALLAVARSVASQEGVDVTWHCGVAETLPFLDASFDLVLMQHVLQYVQDQAAALNEVRRVVVPGGRVISSTWSAIEDNPVHQILTHAIERVLGASAMQAQFALGDPVALEQLFVDAGFESVTSRVVRRRDYLPAPDQFVAFAVAGAVAAMPALQGMDQQARDHLVDAIRDEVRVPLTRYTEGGFIITPMEAHIVLAHTHGR